MIAEATGLICAGAFASFVLSSGFGLVQKGRKKIARYYAEQAVVAA